MARFELRCGNEIYSGWKSMHVSRALEQATATFELAVSERWPIEGNAWQIFPGTACEIEIEGELILTGYVDSYGPGYDANSHDIACTGRSKTLDFVDCSWMGAPQFKGITPGELAKQLAAQSNIEVVIEHDGEVIKDCQVSQGETCFALLERMAKLQELLITDDAQGRLVLTRAGATKATSVLEQGVNLKRANATHDNSERFSDYIVKAQLSGSSSGKNNWSHLTPNPPTPPNPLLPHGLRYAQERAAVTKKETKPKALTQIVATAKDPGITRYRPLVIVGESQADTAEAQRRADWTMRRRIADSKKADVAVVGWHQEDGTLWQQNQLVWIRSKYLGLDHEMLISKVSYGYDGGGEITDLELVMPDSLLPEPKRKAKGKKGTGTGGGMWGHLAEGSGNVS
jgi:prophage tail gpP-like protein